MKSYIAPIYCQTNSLSQEKLTLGLIMFAVDVELPTIFFKLSEKKIQIASSITDISKAFFNTAEKYIQNVVKEIQNEYSQKYTQLLPSKKHILDESMYDYLHKYAHGLIEFGALKPYNGKVNEQIFQQLFTEFTGDTSAFSKKSKKPNLSKQLQQYLEIPELEETADKYLKFTPKQLPGIYKPTTAELITVNGDVESLHALDFQATMETVTNHLNELEVFYHALLVFIEGKSNLEKLSIAFQKPKAGSKQEMAFNTAYQLKKSIFNFMSLDEVEEFVNSLATDQYQKFSSVFGNQFNQI